MNVEDKRRELAAVEAVALQGLTQRLAEVEGHADRLRAQLLDLEGAHDRHPVAVR